MVCVECVTNTLPTLHREVHFTTSVAPFSLLSTCFISFLLFNSIIRVVYAPRRPCLPTIAGMPFPARMGIYAEISGGLGFDLNPSDYDEYITHPGARQIHGTQAATRKRLKVYQ